METGNQREGYGRSRGKWSRKKEREKQKEQQREHLDLLNPEKETPEKQEEKNAGRKIAVAVGGTVLTAAVAAGAVYVGMGQKYKRVYFPNTTINGLDVSGLTPDEVKKQITDETSGYTMILQERGGENEAIRGSDIDLHPEFDGTLEKILENQSPLAWGFHIGRISASLKTN